MRTTRWLSEVFDTTEKVFERGGASPSKVPDALASPRPPVRTMASPVSASSLALAGGAPAAELSNRVIQHLSNQAAAERDQPRTWLAAAA